jgi:hypothetical protein
MSDSIIKSLALATAHWLAYKKASGFENAVSEALLIIPLAECLSAKGYSFQIERDTSFLGIGNRGEFNYDAIATNGDSTIILETKYLKSAKSGENRIYIDLLKLALPTILQCPKKSCKRLLVVAGSSDSLSLTVKKLSTVRKVLFRRDAMQEKPTYNEFDLGAMITKSQELQMFAKRLDALPSGQVPHCFNITLPFEPAEACGEKVAVFSVNRD